MKINLKNLKNLKQGIKNLTQLQLAQARIFFIVGTIVGLFWGTWQSISTKSYGFAVFLFFFGCLQIVSLVTEVKGYSNLKILEESVKELQQEAE